ncbi:MAG: DUF1573 domain-containing protein [Muribaculaceae bacterium]|nr:DUF1573 domain-containing protein [Muribaculaceae bacterium]
MKRYIYRLMCAVALIFACAMTVYAGDKKPEVSFDNTHFDFGTVRESAAPVQTEFVMTNTGSEPVAILSASTTCGCSRAEYPKEPVKPGKSVKIKVKFNPAGQHGEISREVKLRIKGSGKKSVRVPLKITGVVVP